MSSFIETKDLLVLREGEYDNDPNDPGRETHWGISKRSYPKLDIKNLKFEDACNILELDYWNKYRLSEINYQLSANKLFFAFINLNPYSVARAAQNAINACNGTVPVDSIFGTKTISALNRIHQGWFIDRFSIELCEIYLGRVEQNKKLIEYLDGWIKRAFA